MLNITKYWISLWKLVKKKWHCYDSGMKIRIDGVSSSGRSGNHIEEAWGKIVGAREDGGHHKKQVPLINTAWLA